MIEYAHKNDMYRALMQKCDKNEKLKEQFYKAEEDYEKRAQLR